MAGKQVHIHVGIGIATLDHVSRGRAGWRPPASGRSSDAHHFGRREFPAGTDGRTMQRFSTSRRAGSSTAASCTTSTAGLDGFRLWPGALPHDLTGITRGLVPELRGRGAFREEYEADTLRGLLGLSRPANRYARVS